MYAARRTNRDEALHVLVRARCAYVTASRRTRHPDEAPGLEFDVILRWEEEQARYQP